MKLSAGSELVLIKVTCSEQEVMIGSGVADPVGLEVTTGASTEPIITSCSEQVTFMRTNSKQADRFINASPSDMSIGL